METAGSCTSSTLVLNTGCVLSRAFFTLFTHDCVSIHSSNTSVKLQLTPTLQQRVSYRIMLTYYSEQVTLLNSVQATGWSWTAVKPRRKIEHALLLIYSEEVNNIKVLHIHIAALNMSRLVEKAQHRLFSSGNVNWLRSALSIFIQPH